MRALADGAWMCRTSGAVVRGLLLLFLVTVEAARPTQNRDIRPARSGNYRSLFVRPSGKVTFNALLRNWSGARRQRRFQANASSSSSRSHSSSRASAGPAGLPAGLAEGVRRRASITAVNATHASASLLQEQEPPKQPKGSATDAAASVTDAAAEETTTTTTESDEDEEEEVERPDFHEVESDDSVCKQDLFARGKACPKRCPYAAEMKHKFCHFRCVTGIECGLAGTNENQTIPDKHHHMCRHCEVHGCLECVPGIPGATGERFETCARCMPGYIMSEDGKHCQSSGDYIFAAILLPGVVFLAVAVIWYIQLLCKPCVNPAAIDEAIAARTRTLLLAPGGDRRDPAADTAPDSAERQPYPLSTNLTTTNVAGPGTMVFFRFQCVGLLWATVLLGVWLAFAAFVSTDILILGTMPAATPAEFCAVVHWGRMRQMDLKWVKVTWLAIAYVFSFIGAILYAIREMKLFAQCNLEHSTMSDFVAVLEGFGKCKGGDRVEDMLKQAVAEATGEEVVGVSVAWDFVAHAGKLRHALEQEMESIDACHSLAQAGARMNSLLLMSQLANEPAPPAPGHEGEAPSPSVSGGLLARFTKMLLNMWHVHLDDDDDPHHHHAENLSDQEIKDILNGLETTSRAYVTFTTEVGRDRAVESAQGKGVKVKDATCTLQDDIHEPCSILWQNLSTTNAQRSAKVMAGVGRLLVSCLLWTIVLYLPYVHYMASFSYANGDHPSHLGEYIFVAIVYGSQIFLFIVSSAAATQCDYHYEDQRQKAYIIFYTSSLILNLFLDISLQCILSYQQMVGVGTRTADGRLLSELVRMQEIFESYPMQKSIGNVLFKYCWPCTFLLPFAAEPLIAQLLPYHVGKMLIGSNQKIQKGMAEKVLHLHEMELGRYADIMFNMVLACSIPFISPAYMAWTFGAMLISHACIYLIDQVKVLRLVARFNFSSPIVNQFGQKLFAIPTSLLAGCLVFQLNVMSGAKAEKLGAGYLQDGALAAAVAGAIALHLIVHCAILDHCIPTLAGMTKHEHSTETYEIVAATTPATYASTNPVHCLRSKYIYEHRPPQCFYAAGKEHLMEVNPQIGAYYKGGSGKFA